MKASEISALINVAFSLVELVLRIQKGNPDLSKEDSEKLASLIVKIRSLEQKPDKYLENWSDEKKEDIPPEELGMGAE